jgi:hypothetical protein
MGLDTEKLLVEEPKVKIPGQVGALVFITRVATLLSFGVCRKNPDSRISTGLNIKK